MHNSIIVFVSTASSERRRRARPHRQKVYNCAVNESKEGGTGIASEGKEGSVGTSECFDRGRGHLWRSAAQRKTMEPSKHEQGMIVNTHALAPHARGRVRACSPTRTLAHIQVRRLRYCPVLRCSTLLYLASSRGSML